MIGSKALEILLGEGLGHLQVERIVGVEEHAGRIESDPTDLQESRLAAIRLGKLPRHLSEEPVEVGSHLQPHAAAILGEPLGQVGLKVLVGDRVRRPHRPLVPSGPGVERRGAQTGRRHLDAEPLPHGAPRGREIEVRREDVEAVLGRPVDLGLPLVPVPPVGRVLAVHHVLAHGPARSLDDVDPGGRQRRPSRNLLAVPEESHAAELLQVAIDAVERRPGTPAEDHHVAPGAVVDRLDQKPLLAQVARHAQFPCGRQGVDRAAPADRKDRRSAFHRANALGVDRRRLADDLGGVFLELRSGVRFGRRRGVGGAGSREHDQHRSDSENDGFHGGRLASTPQERHSAATKKHSRSHRTLRSHRKQRFSLLRAVRKQGSRTRSSSRRTQPNGAAISLNGLPRESKPVDGHS